MAAPYPSAQPWLAQNRGLDAGPTPGNGERVLPSVLATTKALIRDQTLRRQCMFYLTLGAMLMVFAGGTFLQAPLAGSPWIMLGYWAVCGWLTITVALLAMFDILIIRAAARVQRRRLREELDLEGADEP